jgi:hypothetical protein
MRHTIQGLEALSLALAAAMPLRAGHVRDASPAASGEGVAAPADTGGKHHAGRKHGTGRKWLSYDAATNTVTFKLVAGRSRKKGLLNFNGHADGKATLVVPAKSGVVMQFVNQDSMPHSAVLIPDKDPMPNVIEKPAILHAATRELAVGLPRLGTDEMHFTAPASGSFRIVSGVPGQAVSGMWIRFRVDPAAKQPTWSKGK